MSGSKLLIAKWGLGSDLRTTDHRLGWVVLGYPRNVTTMENKTQISEPLRRAKFVAHLYLQSLLVVTAYEQIVCTDQIMRFF